jgi:CelD/BcsL family acetyltransferase involved in cellulose biosynthesis
MIQIVDAVGENEWKDFLSNCEAAAIYHTPEWKKFLEKTFSYEPHYIFALNETGRIIAMLPFFSVKSKLTGSRLCSVPFSHICGYIGDDSAFDTVMNEALSLYKFLSLDYLEIRSAVDADGFAAENKFHTYILELSPTPEAVWKKFNSNAKRNIKKAANIGVSVEATKNMDDLRRFYELNCINKRDIGVPCHPWGFFENLFDILNDYVHLYVSKHDNKTIGGGIMLCYKDTALYAYGASRPEFLKYYPYYAYIWRCIEDFCHGGYKVLDFGRSDSENAGLIEFKKRWGTAEKRLDYSYYPGIPQSIGHNRDSVKFRLAARAINCMPVSIYKKLSDITFQHFG